jgi:hypothetical protein
VQRGVGVGLVEELCLEIGGENRVDVDVVPLDEVPAEPFIVLSTARRMLVGASVGPVWLDGVALALILGR